MRSGPVKAIVEILGSVPRPAVVLAVLALLLTPPAGADDAGDLASQLSTLRGEVEALSNELDLAKEDHKSRMRSLASQKAELEMDIQREELRLKQLKSSQRKQAERVSENEDRKVALRPAVEQAMDLLRAAVERGLPFKREERLAEIDDLGRQLDDGTLSVPVVLSRLWSKVEDELRLARENGLYKQIVVVDGEEMLTDVARVGMVMLFFRTRDGEYGRAVRGPEGWSYEVYSEQEDHEMVAALFEAFKKHIRVGYFELPACLPPETAP
jgi:hypothetical protein